MVSTPDSRRKIWGKFTSKWGLLYFGQNSRRVLYAYLIERGLEILSLSGRGGGLVQFDVRLGMNQKGCDSLCGLIKSHYHSVNKK